MIHLEDFIRDIPDFPKPGILFKDITPLLGNPAAFASAVERLSEIVKSARADCLVAIESRGFLFAAPIAVRLGLPLVPVRKPGKLPYKVRSVEYKLEYGSGRLDVHEDGVSRGSRVAIIDDLLATGGTAAAAGKLTAESGGVVALYAFVIELAFLNGRALLGETPVAALINY